jgi:crotonobetaine/carnitine-CoA ligase
MAVETSQFMRTCLWPLLREQAAATPHSRFVECLGESFTYAEAQEVVAHVATGLRGFGIERGDRIAILAENSVDTLFAWLGANAAGIADVPINIEARGDFLRFLLGDAQPRAVVATAARLTALAELTTELPEIAVVLDGEPAGIEGYQRVLRFSELRQTAASPDDIDHAAHRTSDLATIMYTSGTTGPSKGVMLPHGYYAGFGRVIAERFDLAASDVSYCAQPLYHIDARITVAAALSVGAAVTLGGRFSPRRFWDEIRACGATRFIYIGTMVWMLFKQEDSDDDAGQPAPIGLGSSTPWEILDAFERRFNTTLIEAYGMTEAVLLTCNTFSDRRHGSVGRATPVVDLAVVNDLDEPLPVGEEGEIVFRPRHPNIVTQGYWNRPAATAEAWRNLWFHTGDVGRIDDEGFVYYIGRAKDSIRRRGENVSAWEVEQALTLHPEVLEAAAFGVASEVGEEEVAVLCVIKTDGGITQAELHEFVSRDLPRFAVPRYIEFVDSLPKTPSERVAKAAVRERGLTDAAWDATDG